MLTAKAVWQNFLGKTQRSVIVSIRIAKILVSIYGVMSFIDKVIESLENGDFVVRIICDSPKAFDTVGNCTLWKT